MISHFCVRYGRCQGRRKCRDRSFLSEELRLALLHCPDKIYEVKRGAYLDDNRSRRDLNSTVRFHVLMRDERRCTHVHENGNRCIETRGLEVHHLIEVANGGDDSVGNLVTLCGFHHQFRHRNFVITSQRPTRRKNRAGIWIGEPDVDYTG